MKEIIESFADWIQKWVDAHGCTCSDIAILYIVKSIGVDPAEYIPLRRVEALEKRGILNNWVSQDYRSKKSYDITTRSVTISTIYSAKGLNYSCVLLMGLDFYGPEMIVSKGIKNLAYVGITARYRLSSLISMKIG
jgi:superfamily I DNA and RNA helicase